MTQPSQPAETFHCPLCGGTTFRRSRFTWQDLSRLILLEIPLRCQDCGERAMVALPKAIKAMAASANRRPKINQQDQ